MAIIRFDKASGGLTRRSVIKAGLGGASFALAAPAYLRYARAQDGPIRIGMPVPLSGPYSTEAQDQVRCAEIAVAQFNEAGGLNGRMAELLVRDDRLDPGEAATRALELIESDGVDFLFASLSSSVQLSVNQVASQRGVIYNSISQSDTINEPSDFTRFTFHEALNPHMTAGAVGRHVFPNAKRAAYLLADYAYGHEMLRGFERAGEELGVEKVEEIRHPIGQADFSAFFPRIQAARPDILIVCNFGRDLLNTVTQANSFGINQQMTIATPVLLYSQVAAGGPAVFAGVLGGANYYWKLEDEHESAKRLNDAYRAAHNAVPTDYAAYGFAGVYGLLEGAKAASSTEADAVIAAMEAMTYDPCKGEQRFRTCDHQALQSVLVLQAKAEVSEEGDLFDIVVTEPAGEETLRTCGELGHA